eukprot:591399-Amphidinium_carterae.1
MAENMKFYQTNSQQNHETLWIGKNATTTGQHVTISTDLGRIAWTNSSSAICLSQQLGIAERTKHIDIRYIKYLHNSSRRRDHYTSIPTENNPADPLNTTTKIKRRSHWTAEQGFIFSSRTAPYSIQMQQTRRRTGRKSRIRRKTSSTDATITVSPKIITGSL